MAVSLYAQMKEKIEKMDAGEVMTVSDFCSLAVPKTVSKMLTRLCLEGKIRKVLRSIFWKPSKDLKNPDPHLVAEALARENNWDLIPSGETALHLLGLEEEKPSVWTYITNGTYREYKLGDVIISFTHTKADIFENMSKKTALLVQSIRAIGKNQMTEENMMKLLQQIGKDADIQWNRIREESRCCAEWISDTLKVMAAMWYGLQPVPAV